MMRNRQEGNMTIYFKETRDIFGINWKEQGISLQGNSYKKREQLQKKGTLMGFINRKQKSKSEIFKVSKKHTTPLGGSL